MYSFEHSSKKKAKTDFEKYFFSWCSFWENCGKYEKL